MTAPETPAPEFQRFLEWQIRSELRRADRFGPAGGAAPERPGRLPRLVGIVALVAVSVLVGATGTVAADRMQDGRKKALLVERETLRLEFAEEWAAALGEQLREIERRVEAGVATESESIAARARQADAEAKAELARIDLDEVRQTGEEPRDDLSAPVGSARDWVGDRLQVRLDLATRRHETRQSHWRRQQALLEAAVVTEEEVALARRELEEVEAEIDLLRARMDLRRSFLDGERTATDVEREDLRARSDHVLGQLLGRLQGLRAEEERARVHLEAGIVTEYEVMKVQSEVRELEVEIRGTEIQVQILTLESVDEGDGEDPPRGK